MNHSEFNFFEKQRLYFLLLLLLVFAGVLFLIRNTGLLVDEFENYNQILNFTNGNFKLLEISAMPGYHAVMAGISKLTGLSSISALRCLSAIFGILTVVFFYKLAGRIHHINSVLRTIQFALFPPIFIYFFLLYTDILSLLLVMLMFLFAFDKKYVLAGVFGILSMMIRQNNIIWLGFIPVMMYYQNYGSRFTLENIIVVTKKSWVFIIGFLLFIGFIIINKGVAIGDASKHPAFVFSSGNIIFFLFCIFIFFLPIHIANIPKVFNLIKTNKWFIPISFLLVAFYWFTFKVDHPYNQIETHYFLRNLILTRFTANDVMKMIFFLPVLYSFWSLVVIEFTNRTFYLLYIFIIIFIAPSWLIEQRYYIIPFMLFMLFRKEQSTWVEVLNVLFYIVFLIWLIPLIAATRAFL